MWIMPSAWNFGSGTVAPRTAVTALRFQSSATCGESVDARTGVFAAGIARTVAATSATTTADGADASSNGTGDIGDPTTAGDSARAGSR